MTKRYRLERITDRDPDQEVVDQARHDFCDMILTKEVIAANRPPWASA